MPSFNGLQKSNKKKHIRKDKEIDFLPRGNCLESMDRRRE
jgi:hypothetical protein